MNDLSLLFLGTSSFALECLKELNETRGLQVKGLVTAPDRPQNRGLKHLASPVKAWGQKQTLPVWTPHHIQSPDFQEEISKQFFDCAVVIAYGHILPKSFLNLFPKGIVNIHPSLLPRWRGAAPIERALLAGDKKTGVCLQVVDEKLDAGDIIKSYAFPIKDQDSALEVYESVKEFSKKILKEDLLKYFNGTLRSTPQKEEGLIYAKKILKQECLIDWSQPADQIHNQIRGLILGPQAFTFFKNKRVKIYRAEALSKTFPLCSPGEVVSCEEEELIVACGQGTLKLLEIQQESRNKQKAKEFLKGQRVQKRDSFNNVL